MPQEHVEQIVVLTHTSGDQPCGGVAMHATLSWLGDLIASGGSLVCLSCVKKGRGEGARITLADTSGDEPYLPLYQPQSRS